MRTLSFGELTTIESRFSAIFATYPGVGSRPFLHFVLSSQSLANAHVVPSEFVQGKSSSHVTLCRTGCLGTLPPPTKRSNGAVRPFTKKNARKTGKIHIHEFCLSFQKTLVLSFRCDPKGSMAFLQDQFRCTPMLEARRTKRTYRIILFFIATGLRRRCQKSIRCVRQLFSKVNTVPTGGLRCSAGSVKSVSAIQEEAELFCGSFLRKGDVIAYTLSRVRGFRFLKKNSLLREQICTTQGPTFNCVVQVDF